LTLGLGFVKTPGPAKAITPAYMSPDDERRLGLIYLRIHLFV
jgi:hypothetical protein